MTIDKLKRNLPITQSDVEALETILFTEDAAGSREQLEAEYGPMPLGRFIRRIVGLELKAAQAAFSEFQESGDLTADQRRFINTIIDYLTVNGTIDQTKLWESPFTDQHSMGIAGVFPLEHKKVVAIIKDINANAEVA